MQKQQNCIGTYENLLYNYKNRKQILFILIMKNHRTKLDLHLDLKYLYNQNPTQKYQTLNILQHSHSSNHIKSNHLLQFPNLNHPKLYPSKIYNQVCQIIKQSIQLKQSNSSIKKNTLITIKKIQNQDINIKNCLTDQNILHTLPIKQKKVLNQQKKNDKGQSNIAIMNIHLNERSEHKQKKNLEKFQVLKFLIQKRRYERLDQKQRTRQIAKKKCIQLLKKKQTINFEHQINFKIIQQILSEIKKAKSNNQQNSQQQLKIRALQAKPSKNHKFQKSSSLPNPFHINKSKKTNRKQSISIFKTKGNTWPKISTQKMLFGVKDFYNDKLYKKRIMSYIQFLYKINFSNCMFIDLRMQDYELQNSIKYKIFIGKGNNSELIKNLIKRRFWFEIVQINEQTKNKIDFYWTQLNLKQIHDLQKQSVKQNDIHQVFQKVSLIKSKHSHTNLNLKIMNNNDSIISQSYIENFGLKTSIYSQTKITVMTNHIPQNSMIGSKKHLFYSMYFYYKQILQKNPFDYIPESYHIKNINDQNMIQLKRKLQLQNPHKIWILKPGQNTNRGNGISLVYSKDILSNLQEKWNNSNKCNQQTTYIIQSYINKPFLYYNRKFDIRHYIMITSINGILKAFWFRQGYIRTSSLVYNIDDIHDLMIHLTNDAVQKYGQTYGKYQLANKISYSQFQRYLDLNYTSKKYVFQTQILQKMKQITLDVIKANFLKLDSKRKLNNFQIFGLDFMIDSNFKPWLIEINSNPCLEISCPLLGRIIPGLIQNSFRIGLDPLFPPKMHYPPNKRVYLSDNILENLKFELFFDEKIEKDKLLQLLKNKQGCFNNNNQIGIKCQESTKQIQQYDK